MDILSQANLDEGFKVYFILLDNELSTAILNVIQTRQTVISSN